MTVRVLIVEDHTLVREALGSLVAGLPGFEVADTVSDGKGAIRAATVLQPELVLMDLSMPGMSGMDAATEIRRRFPDVHVVFLTLSRDEKFVREAFGMGADAYLLKGASLEEFELALHCVVQGKKYLSSELSAAMATGTHFGHSAEPGSSWKNLSGRERSILKLIAEGNTNRSAAEYLCISTKTVEKHRSSLMRKLGLRSAAELAVVAIDMGLVERASVAGPRRRAMPDPGMTPAPLRSDESGLFC
ncbi:response regulator [Massilia sp. CMS3.1]|uniref:response regulator n=1 Tax=Massilia sp. CMS3.1 TaxID=3373083 RepID=UPI003EE51C91